MARFGLDSSDSEEEEVTQSRQPSRTPAPVDDSYDLDHDDDEEEGAEGTEEDDEEMEQDDAPPRASLLSDDEDEDEEMHDDDDDEARSTRTRTPHSRRRSPAPEPPTPYFLQPSTGQPRLTPLQQHQQQQQQAQSSAPRHKVWAERLDLEPKRVQVMQASFFGQGHNEREAREEQAREEKERKADKARKGLAASPFENLPAVPQPTSVPTPAIDPTPFRTIRKYHRVPLSESYTNGKEGNFVDLGLATGRSFRAGWGQKGQFVKLVEGSGSKSDLLEVKKLRYTTPSTSSTSPATSSHALLPLLLQHTPIYPPPPDSEDPSPPFAVPHPLLRFSHFASSFTPGDRSPEASLWRLGHALFDEIEDADGPLSGGMEGVEETRYLEGVRRKHLVERWLERDVLPSVEADLRSLPSTSSTASSSAAAAQRIFLLLTGHQLPRACQAAIDTNNFRIGTLLAQAGGDDEYRQDVFLQLAKWKEYGVEEFVEKGWRKVWSVLAGDLRGDGETENGEADGGVKVREGLDWKRAWGMELWYGSWGTGLEVSVKRYEEDARRSSSSSSSGGEVKLPRPSYLSSSSSQTVSPSEQPHLEPIDPAFAFLKLFSNPTYPLEIALAPKNFSPSPLHLRLSWILYILFSRVLRRRDFEDRYEVNGGGEGDDGMEGGGVEGNSPRADGLTEGYAAQLEGEGQWDWAAFVLLFLELPERRTKAIQELLARNVDAIDEDKFTWLTETLKIPESWIYAAQALSQHYSRNPFAAYQLYLAASLPSTAHRIAVTLLAPEAIIRSDLPLLHRLFEPFIPHHLSPAEWEEGGKVFVQYGEVMEGLKRGVGAGQKLKEVLKGLSKLEERWKVEGGLKLRVATAEMQSRLTAVAGGLNLHLDSIQPAKLQEADRLVWLQGTSKAFLDEALEGACVA